MKCDMEGCDVDISGVEGALGWKRWATQAEIDQYHQSGDLPASENSAEIAVRACPEHAITVDQASYTHDATCTAPPGCDCSIAETDGPHEGEDTL
jgi:hypothetical protein